MKVCAACEHEYKDEFRFCPECGHKFGGDAADELKQKLDQNLMNMKNVASREAALSRRVFAGQGLGDSRVYGHTGGEWGNAGL